MIDNLITAKRKELSIARTTLMDLPEIVSSGDVTLVTYYELILGISLEVRYFDPIELTKGLAYLNRFDNELIKTKVAKRIRF